MTPEEGAGARRPARWLKPLLLAAAVGGAAAAGGLFFLQSRLSLALADYLRREVFPDPERAAFSEARIDLLRTDVSLKGLRLKSAPGRPARALSVVDATADLSLFSFLLSGSAPRLRLLRLSEPSLEVSYGGGAPEAPADEKDPLLWLRRIPLEQVEAERAFLRLKHAAGGRPVELDAMRLRLTRQAGGRGFSLEGNGVFGEAEAGTFSLRVSMPEAEPCPSEGEIRIDKLAVPLLASYFPGEASVLFSEGRASLKTQFTCRDGWLTASHLVELEGLKARPPEGKKEVFGVPLKYFEEVLRIDQLSFVVPMNGSLSDPHIGVASSVQQILLKALQPTVKDPREAEKLARKGGDYFGRKIDRELKAWLGGE